MTCGNVSVGTNSNAFSPADSTPPLTTANLALHNRRLLTNATKSTRGQAKDVELFLTEIGAHLNICARNTSAEMVGDLHGTDMNGELDRIIAVAAASATKQADDRVKRVSEVMNGRILPLLSWQGILDDVPAGLTQM